MLLEQDQSRRRILANSGNTPLIGVYLFTLFIVYCGIHRYSGTVSIRGYSGCCILGGKAMSGRMRSCRPLKYSAGPVLPLLEWSVLRTMAGHSPLTTMGGIHPISHLPTKGSIRRAARESK